MIAAFSGILVMFDDSIKLNEINKRVEEMRLFPKAAARLPI